MCTHRERRRCPTTRSRAWRSGGRCVGRSPGRAFSSTRRTPDPRRISISRALVTSPSGHRLSYLLCRWARRSWRTRTAKPLGPSGEEGEVRWSFHLISNQESQNDSWETGTYSKCLRTVSHVDRVTSPGVCCGPTGQQELHDKNIGLTWCVIVARGTIFAHLNQNYRNEATFHHYLRIENAEGYDVIAVYWFVCVRACYSHNSKSIKPNRMKFGGMIGYYPGTIWLDFGIDRVKVMKRSKSSFYHSAVNLYSISMQLMPKF